MPITLPTGPAADSFDPVLITAGTDQRSGFGNITRRTERLGGVWEVQVVLEPMQHDTALGWSDLDEQGLVRWALPMNGLTVGTPGSAVVDGAGQYGGNTLAVRAMTPNYTLQKGRWVSVSTGGLLYLYRIRSDVTASGTGTATLPIRPYLRG